MPKCAHIYKSIHFHTERGTCIKKHTFDNCNKFSCHKPWCRVSRPTCIDEFKNTMKAEWVMDRRVFDNRLSGVVSYKIHLKWRCRGCVRAISSTLIHVPFFDVHIHTHISKRRKTLNHFLAEWIAINICSMLNL